MSNRAMPLAALALLGAAEPDERLVEGDGVIEATVAGVPARLRIDPGTTAMPIITADLAARAGLKPGIMAATYAIGPTRIAAPTAVATLSIGARRFDRRVAWDPRPFAAGSDGAVGPGGLPEAVVRFHLRGPVPGERTVALPMVDQGGIGGRWSELFAEITIGGLPMRVKFDPRHRRSLATAAAATRIARAHDGTLSGAIVPAEIAFGIERPVRAMRLGRALAIGPVALTGLGVRTADTGSAATIREEGADLDEVVVTAGAKPRPGRDRLSIGGDDLSRCSAITYDKPARQVRLTCA